MSSVRCRGGVSRDECTCTNSQSPSTRRSRSPSVTPAASCESRSLSPNPRIGPPASPRSSICQLRSSSQTPRSSVRSLHSSSRSRHSSVRSLCFIVTKCIVFLRSCTYKYAISENIGSSAECGKTWERFEMISGRVQEK